MASWREIDRIRKNPIEMRALATYLLRLPGADLRGREKVFLESIAGDSSVEQFSNRQAEWILQIQEDIEEISEVGHQRLSVKILIDNLKLAYLDLFALDEDKAEWVKAIPAGTTKIKRRYAGRLLRCYRMLNNINDEDAA